MTYYINPWVFYIINLINHISVFCAIILIFGGILWAIMLFIGPEIIKESTDTTEKEESILKTFWKWMKKCPLIFLLCSVFIIFTPSESTVYKMLIASKISTNDVDHITEKIDDAVNSIIESKESSNADKFIHRNEEE